MKSKKFVPLLPSHPTEYISDLIKDRIKNLVSPLEAEKIEEFYFGRAEISAEIAQALHQIFSPSPEFWMNTQKNYNEICSPLAERKMPKRIQVEGDTPQENICHCNSGVWANPFIVNETKAHINSFRVSVKAQSIPIMAWAIKILINSGAAGFPTKAEAEIHAYLLFQVLIDLLPDYYPMAELATYDYLGCSCEKNNIFCHVDILLQKLLAWKIKNIKPAQKENT